MCCARTLLVAVVEELTKFTFYLRYGAWARGLWKSFAFGRISVLIRPNMRFLSLFSMVFGLLSPALLDA